jgi:structural maintenance of chromosome 3 (chondroitin sulfate proteoglycan 6)
MDSSKNSLEIELNESLRRRRGELQAKIETLGEAENGEASATDDLDSRVRELKALNSSIQTLTKKSQGEINSSFSTIFVLTFHLNQKWKRRPRS